MTGFVTRFRARARADRKLTYLSDGRPAVELTAAALQQIQGTGSAD